ncbi:39S ribosomal protein L16 mitochondrial [Echinococcus multilocularis]|uniref:Large ribosomal subunit protein uL16m n=1 Tax=Echinococcus multilocularis TaxID=6211 RepID=A0A068YIS2_ECHMU|nr:39S ribosomal protein L16 mitochondrial [Echinococcus multilocularis]
MPPAIYLRRFSGLLENLYQVLKSGSALFHRIPLPFSERHYVKNYVIRGELDDIEFPPDRRKLHPLLRTPVLGSGERMYKYPRRHYDLRGPETVNHLLNHSQFGIQALEGGELLIGHLDMIRATVNRKIDEKRMFAVWRVPGPWKPKTRKSLGKRMGGGKADIHHYVTPVRANRIIVELGGHLEWREASRILTGIADLLPFSARFVSQELLDMEAKLEFYIAEKNVNPFYPPGRALLKNYAGCRSFTSPWHLEWGDTSFK